MAKRIETQVTLTDDLDGSKADRTVTFSYDGSDYEIELSKKNATALNKALAPYISAGRKSKTVRRTSRAASGKGRTRGRSDLGAVREWANANGHRVSERGRIAQSVQDAYNHAH